MRLPSMNRGSGRRRDRRDDVESGIHAILRIVRVPRHIAVRACIDRQRGRRVPREQGQECREGWGKIATTFIPTPLAFARSLTIQLNHVLSRRAGNPAARGV